MMKIKRLIVKEVNNCKITGSVDYIWRLMLYSVCASFNGSIQPAPYISWCQTRTRTARSAGEQTTHKTFAPPLGTVLPVKMLLRLGLIVTMFNKIHLFAKFQKAHVHQSYHPLRSQTKVLTAICLL